MIGLPEVDTFRDHHHLLFLSLILIISLSLSLVFSRERDRKEKWDGKRERERIHSNDDERGGIITFHPDTDHHDTCDEICVVKFPKYSGGKFPKYSGGKCPKNSEKMPETSLRELEKERKGMYQRKGMYEKNWPKWMIQYWMVQMLPVIPMIWFQW